MAKETDYRIDDAWNNTAISPDCRKIAIVNNNKLISRGERIAIITAKYKDFEDNILLYVQGESVNIIKKNQEYEQDKEWSIEFNLPIDVDSLDNGISILDSKLNKVNVTLKKDTNEKVIKILLQSEGYVPGQSYILHIEGVNGQEDRSAVPLALSISSPHRRPTTSKIVKNIP